MRNGRSRSKARDVALAAVFLGAFPVFGSGALGNAPGPSPDNARGDLDLEVNPNTGDVYLLATTSVAFSGYTISDPSANLLTAGALLLSASQGSGGNTNVYETTGNYVNWFKITETASQIAEGQYGNGFANHSSRDDTINIPAGGTIDFGDIFSPTVDNQDLSFDFAEAGTEPTNGPTYYGAEVDYSSSAGSGTQVYWKNSAASGNWSGVGNWSATGAAGTDNAGPPSGGVVQIVHNDTVNRTITLDRSANIYQLSIANTGGGTDTLVQAGAFNLGMYQENIGSGGVHTQSAGLNTYGYALYVGSGTGSGAGTYNLSGGSILMDAQDAQAIAVGDGAFNQSGGSITLLTGNEIVGFAYGFGTFTQTGGVQTMEDLLIGSDGTRGAFFLGGTGSLSARAVFLGGSYYNTPGAGTLAISSGAIAVTYGVNLMSGGALAQSGGRLTAGSISISSGGTFSLSGGTVSAPVAIAGAFATNGSSNAISITSSLTLQSTATTLAQRTGSGGSFATVSTTGNLTLAGVLAVYEDAQNEAVTTPGQSFVILQATGTGILSGAFSNIASGQTLTTSDGAASFVVTVNPGLDGDVVLSDFQSVPEPAAATAMGFMFGVTLLRRSRARRGS
jgi:hypothetical protein